MKITLLLQLLMFWNFSFSQNITFDQAQNLRTKTLADVETFLTAKNWSMTEAIEEDATTMGKATFGFEVDQFDSEKALSWITYYESNFSVEYNRLTIQIHKKPIYNTYLSRLSANGYKLKSSQIKDGAIEKVYKNSSTTCVVTTATSEGSYTKMTSYSFFFINNRSYQLTFENK